MRLVHSMLAGTLLFGLTLGCDDYGKSQLSASPAPGETPKSPAAPKAIAGQTPTTSQDQGTSPKQTGPMLSGPLRGIVKETMDSGGYTYVLLAAEQGEVWAAAKKFTVAVGEEVEIAGTMPMHDFRSPTLERTFEVIQFASSARVVGGNATAGAPRPPQMPPTQGMPPGHPAIGKAATAATTSSLAAPKPGEIAPLSDGVTVADLFGKKADLKGKPVKFRGRVVKANRNILGMNWLHIQDGTGEPGSNDITVTSKTGFAPPGTMVVVEGTLALEKDFGAGYAYDVIVEDSTVTIAPTSSAPTKAEAPKPGDAEK